MHSEKMKNELKKIKTALISVFHKEGLEPLIQELTKHNCQIISTGGTATYIKNLGIQVTEVASLTDYPSILGGRVKTLHPKVFGGILSRRAKPEDISELETYKIPEIDLVVVDLYPFEETLAGGASQQEIIEKIDIGGISLIRAAAKNYQDVLCVSQMQQYKEITTILSDNACMTDLNTRKEYAAAAFSVSSHYDTQIFHFLNAEKTLSFRESFTQKTTLRYGENPHQKGYFFGELAAIFDKLHGKELSYNNLLDVDAAVNLLAEFKEEKPTFAILKHNNACGLAQRDTLLEAYKDALAGDPISAFGGVLIANKEIDLPTAEEIHKLFCEVVIAPSFSTEALAVLKQKKNRVLLILKETKIPKHQFRTALNGVLYQEKDQKTDRLSHLKTVTNKQPTQREIDDLIFASKICKHTKSNTIVLAKNKQLIASGTGQTSRIDALQQAIDKATNFSFNLHGAVMASDAFFPFPDSVEKAYNAGVTAVIQPGGSIKDQLSIDFCNANNMSMVFSGIRHFKH